MGEGGVHRRRGAAGSVTWQLVVSVLLGAVAFLLVLIMVNGTTHRREPPGPLAIEVCRTIFALICGAWAAIFIGGRAGGRALVRFAAVLGGALAVAALVYALAPLRLLL